MKELVSFDDFSKLDIRIGDIVEASRIEGSKKLLKLQVDFGEATHQIVAGIGKQYTPEELLHIRTVFIMNLEPVTLLGVESQGMILAANSDGMLSLIVPEKGIGIENGSIVS